MEYLASNKIAIIDLATRDIIEEELEDDLVLEKIGGVGITKSLYDRFADENPIVLGTGLLTGSLVPGSALSVITAKSPSTGRVSHVPLTLDAGMELKYSGFDYMVIKGAADKPVYLWVHDGIADLNDAEDLWGKDVWAATDRIRDLMGDDLIQVLGIGEAGEKGSDLAQISINYWQSGDRMGFGSLFGKKRLKLIAIRGMGLLEIAEPEEFVEHCAGLLSALKSGKTSGMKGIATMAAAMGEADIEGWLKPLTHKHMACFNTPVPTNTFVFLDEDPALLKETSVAEPGFLLTDISPLLTLKRLGLTAADACRILKACAKYGMDGAAVAELSEKTGLKDPEAIKGSLPNLKGPVSSSGNAVFSPWAAVGNQEPKTWMRREAVAYIFGLHPIFALMAPELTEEKLLEISSLGTGLELTSETLDEVIADITG
ncbi:MAG: aldehyde:ferredoxin oxidoreductase [Thermodesulfobacteriota bacterium]|nr:aldehyde:ferredoxin oxidoreductase [Thermodesulfobacteriota bacterium]